MITLLFIAVLGQGMFGSPVAPPPPPVDRSAAVIERMAADRHETMEAIGRLMAEIVAIDNRLSRLAAQPPPAPQIIHEPAPPPVRVYVARDVSGFDWEDTDQTRLMNWIELRNARARGPARKVVRTSEVAPVTITRTYTIPTSVVPVAPALPPVTYAPVPGASATVCGPDGCRQVGLLGGFR